MENTVKKNRSFKRDLEATVMENLVEELQSNFNRYKMQEILYILNEVNYLRGKCIDDIEIQHDFPRARIGFYNSFEKLARLQMDLIDKLPMEDKQKIDSMNTFEEVTKYLFGEKKK